MRGLEQRAESGAAAGIARAVGPSLPARVSRAAMIARWKPVHLGHAAVLHALCSRADEALIGIGSANRYDVRNPFTAAETADMLRLLLAGNNNYRLVEIEDLGHGPRWRAMVVERLGPLELFLTDNAYVRSLLADDYRVVRPVELVLEESRIAIDGTQVRYEMAKGDDWRTLVPVEVADYISARGLDRRFRREFGLETLALEAPQA